EWSAFLGVFRVSAVLRKNTAEARKTQRSCSGTSMTASASVDVLRKRAELVRAVRAFFHRRGFWEVETPVWSRESVVDAHLDPVPARMSLDPTSADRGLDGWLQTSPELHMKRLLAAGADAIFQITHAFRAAERGRGHNPEFTIVEWY